MNGTDFIRMCEEKDFEAVGKRAIAEVFAVTKSYVEIDAVAVMLALMRQARRMAAILNGVYPTLHVCKYGEGCGNFNNRFHSDHIWGLKLLAAFCQEKDVVSIDAQDLFQDLAKTADGPVELLTERGGSAFEVLVKLQTRFFAAVESAVPGDGYPEAIRKPLWEIWEGLNSDFNELPLFVSFAQKMKDPPWNGLLIPPGAEVDPVLIRNYVAECFRIFGEDLPQPWRNHSRQTVEPCPAPPPGYWETALPAGIPPNDSELVTASKVMSFAGMTPEPFRARVRAGIFPGPEIQKQGQIPAKWSYRELIKPKSPYRSLRQEFPSVRWPESASNLVRRNH